MRDWEDDYDEAEYEDFSPYSEEIYKPIEVEEKLNEIKSILKEAVREDLLTELATLRKENERLREYERTADANDAKLAKELQKLASERKKLEKNVKNMRIRELFGDFISTAWCVQTIYNEKPKCDKCNDKRQLEYKTPRGVTMHENCECSEKLIHYEPKQTELIEIQSCERFGENEIIRTYYTAGTLGTTGKVIEDSVQRTSLVYNGRPFKELKGYNKSCCIFLDKAKCEEYCDYLNNKEKEK